MESSPSPRVWIVEDLGQQKLQAREVSTLLRDWGMRVRLVDLNQETDALLALARAAPPQLVVLSILYAGRIREQLNLCHALKSAGLGAHITMVGDLASLVPAQFLAAYPDLDSVIIGETRAALWSLAQWVRDPSRPRAVPGLAERGHAPLPQPPSEQPDRDGDIPWATRDAEQPSFHGYHYATVRASAGCYHACTFCLPAAVCRRNGKGYRVRGIADVVDEIEALYQRGTRLFLFDDEQFLPPVDVRAERVSSFARELDCRGLRIAFTIKCRADDVDGTLLTALKHCGLVRVYVGIESGDDATLALYGKGVTAERNAAALAVLNELGIVADLRALILHPWSTCEALEREVQFLNRVRPVVTTLLDIRSVQVFPGTPMARRLAARDGGNSSPWPAEYSIADPRAEIVRRLCQLVFGSGGYPGLRDAFKDAWYACLLSARFQPGSDDAERAKLRGIARTTNAAVLDVLREILDWVGTGDIYDAERVNTYAGTVAARIGSLRAEVRLQLTEPNLAKAARHQRWRRAFARFRRA